MNTALITALRNTHKTVYRAEQRTAYCEILQTTGYWTVYHTRFCKHSILH